MRAYSSIISLSLLTKPGGFSVKNELLLSQLEDLANRLGIAVRHFKFIRDESSGGGGLCRIRGEYVLFIDSQATTKEKILVMIEAIKQFDLGDIQVLPVIRELLEGIKGIK